MSSQNNDYANQLTLITKAIPYYFGVSLPWLALICNTFTLGVLYLKKRNEKTTMIFLLKCQYICDTIYIFNLLFNDRTFTSPLFGYSLQSNVSDFICKFDTIILRFIYCTSSWMQVVK